MRPYKQGSKPERNRKNLGADIGWDAMEGVMFRLLNLVRVFHKWLNVAVKTPRYGEKNASLSRRARACPSPCLGYTNARGGQAPALR